MAYGSHRRPRAPDSLHPLTGLPRPARPVSDRRLALIIFILGVVSGLIYLASPILIVQSGLSEEEAIGVHLARGEGFVSPFAVGRGAPPTSWCPPVYPAVVAVIYRTLGVRSVAGLAAVLLFNFACRAAAGAALFLLGRRVFGRAAGGVAAALFLAHPMFLQMPVFYWDNCLSLAMFLWLLLAAFRLRDAGPHVGSIAALGAGLGALALTNTSYTLTFPLIVLLAVGPRPWRRPGMIAAAAGAFLLVLLPWTARNYSRFGKVFFVRANVYTELWLGNQPCSTGWMTLQTLDAHPSRDRDNAYQVLGLGEIRYFDLCRRRFDADYRAAPAAFRARCRNRLIYAFLSDPGRKIEYPLMPNREWHGVVVDRLLVNALLATLGLAAPGPPSASAGRRTAWAPSACCPSPLTCWRRNTTATSCRCARP